MIYCPDCGSSDVEVTEKPRRLFGPKLHAKCLECDREWDLS